jgi:hypothetical protein
MWLKMSWIKVLVKLALTFTKHLQVPTIFVPPFGTSVCRASRLVSKQALYHLSHFASPAGSYNLK